MRNAVQQVCEELGGVLERAARLYVSPRFEEALLLVSQHQPHLSWLLKTPALAVCLPRYDEILCEAYHLLRLHTCLHEWCVRVDGLRAGCLKRKAGMIRCVECIWRDGGVVLIAPRKGVSPVH